MIYLQSVIGLSNPDAAREEIEKLKSLDAETNQVDVMNDLVSIVLKGSEEVMEQAKEIIRSLEPQMLGWGKVMIYDGASLFDEVTVGPDAKAACAA